MRIARPCQAYTALPLQPSPNSYYLLLLPVAVAAPSTQLAMDVPEEVMQQLSQIQVRDITPST
jgi:hypothetical protein